MKRVAGLTVAMLVAMPMAVTALEEPAPRDLCLRVGPASSGKNGDDTSGLWRYTPKQIAKSIRRGTMEVVGPGTHCGDTMKPIVGFPRDDLVDVDEVPWTKLEFRSGGRKVDVHFGNGAPECFGLNRVEVSTNDTGLDVRVFAGSLPPDQMARGCAMPLLPWVTTVDLGERLAFGSRGEDREAEIVWQQQVQALQMEAIHELAERLPGHIRFVPHESDYYQEDFRFTSEGRRYAEQFVKNPEATKDTLVNILLRQEGLQPAFPPPPWEEAAATAE